MSAAPADSSAPRRLGLAIVTVAFLGAVIGGVGAPLITSVALGLRVPLDAAQWTLTVTLFAGAIAAPVLGRLGAGSHRRTAILTTLALVAAGGLLTTIPLPFGVLLVGRALQGLGLGAVALLMSVARDHLPTERPHATIATVSVASAVGIGIAYPLMGLIDQLAGLRVAYGVGFLLSLAAVLIAWRTIPEDPPRPPVGVDVPGAVLLGLGTLSVLVVVAQPSVWDTPWVGAAILIAAIALWAWVLVERRAAAPLVDLDLFTKGAVLRANTAMLTSGVGMYLLFSLLTRYVQTPPQAGYGFGLSGVLAGAALIPFSVLGFVAGRLTPWLTSRVSARWTFVIYAAFVASPPGCSPPPRAHSWPLSSRWPFSVSASAGSLRSCPDSCSTVYRNQRPPASCRSTRSSATSGSASAAPLQASCWLPPPPPVRCLRMSRATSQRPCTSSRYSCSAPSPSSPAERAQGADRPTLFTRGAPRTGPLTPRRARSCRRP